MIISVALMLFSGFLMTRLTKLARLPNVTAYILAGILIGPYVLNLVPQRIIDGTDFLSDIALAFIAFSTGEFFKLDILKRNGMKVVWITILEAVLASVFIFILTYFVLRLDLAFSIVLAALASATAPASTMMTIRQTGAKGDFVDTLLQVVALDDVVGLVLYSVAISIALASLSGASGFSFETLGKPVVLNLPPIDSGRYFRWISRNLSPSRILRFLKEVGFIGRWQEMFNIAAVQVASAAGVPVIDIRSAFLAQPDFRSYLCADGIHPNEAGQKLIYGAIRRQLPSAT